MPLSSKHPRYVEVAPDWKVIRDTHAGERRVKEMGTEYLPATSGMIAAGMYETANALIGRVRDDGQIEAVTSTSRAITPGLAQYTAYVTRAVFHELVQASAEALIGIMHRKPPVIELPEALEPLRDDATQDREGLATLLRRINEEQLLAGRLGLLLDVRGETNDVYLSTYSAESILNWAVDRVESPGRLLFAVLDESGDTLQSDFSYARVERYLVLGDVRAALVRDAAASPDALPEAGEDAGYVAAAIEGDAEDTELPFKAVQIGGRGLGEIPFVTIGAKDLQWDPDKPPLLRVASMALAIYRGEADYRHSLFMQGQETLVTIGLPSPTGYAEPGEAVKGEPLMLGANGRIDLPLGGDAKFIGVSAAGLSAMKDAIENDKRAAAEYGAQIIGDRSGGAESGDALEIRVAARTATLSSVALAGAQGLERILKMAAVWKGANPDEVKVTPNLDFAGTAITGSDILQIMQAKAMGLPLSNQSVHDWLARKGFTGKTFEEEQDEIAEEGPAEPPTADRLDDPADGPAAA